MTNYKALGHQAAICFNSGNKVGYQLAKKQAHRAIFELPDDDKLKARQDYDLAYRQGRTKC